MLKLEFEGCFFKQAIFEIDCINPRNRRYFLPKGVLKISKILPKFSTPIFY